MPGNAPGNAPGRGVGLLLLVLVVGAWLTGPLWGAQGEVFGLLAGDGVRTAWFYDFVARGLAEGGVSTLWDFNHPEPLRRYEEMSTVLDAVIAAPLSGWLSWPGQYGAVQAFWVLVNGLGFAILARALGAQGVGVVLAGLLGLACQPAWKEIHMGRLNAASPGLAGMALAAWIGVLVPRERRSQQVWRIGLAGVFGACAVMVYPLFLVMLAPAGIWIAALAWRQWGWRVLGPAACALGLGLVVAYPELGHMLASPRGALADCSGEAPLACGLLHQGGELHVAHYLRLSGWLGLARPESFAGIEPGVAVGAWILAGFALLSRQRRGLVIGLLGCVVLCIILARGPCPQGAEAGLSRLGFWCPLQVVHDYGRFASMATLLLAGLSGVGLEALGSRFGKRTWIAGVVGLLAAGQALAFARIQLMEPARWTPVPTLPSTAWIQTLDRGALVELPFSSRLQFLSVLAAPGRPRLNPVDEDRAPAHGGIVDRWFSALGHGQSAEQVPSRAQVEAQGVGWVLFEPARCRDPISNARPSVYPFPSRVSARACSPVIAEEIAQVLGEGKALGEEGALIWQVGGP